MKRIASSLCALTLLAGCANPFLKQCTGNRVEKAHELVSELKKYEYNDGAHSIAQIEVDGYSVKYMPDTFGMGTETLEITTPNGLEIKDNEGNASISGRSDVKWTFGELDFPGDTVSKTGYLNKLNWTKEDKLCFYEKTIDELITKLRNPAIANDTSRMQVPYLDFFDHNSRPHVVNKK